MEESGHLRVGVEITNARSWGGGGGERVGESNARGDSQTMLRHPCVTSLRRCIWDGVSPEGEASVVRGRARGRAHENAMPYTWRTMDEEHPRSSTATTLIKEKTRVEETAAITRDCAES